MKTRSQKTRVRARWDTEWKELRDKGQVGTIEGMLTIIGDVLDQNAVPEGWHWCILLEAQMRGQLAQVEYPSPKDQVEVEGKFFNRVNTALVFVNNRKFTVPIYEEKNA